MQRYYHPDFNMAISASFIQADVRPIVKLSEDARACYDNSGNLLFHADYMVVMTLIGEGVTAKITAKCRDIEEVKKFVGQYQIKDPSTKMRTIEWTHATLVVG